MKKNKVVLLILMKLLSLTQGKLPPSKPTNHHIYYIMYLNNFYEHVKHAECFQF